MKQCLFVADCVDFMKDMGAASVDLTLTSPPYDDMRDYNGYHFDFEAVAEGLYRVTKEGGVVVWIVGDQTKDGDESGTSFRQALYFKEIGFKLFDTMIWRKNNSGPFGSNRSYRQCFEYMFVFSKGLPKTATLLRDVPNANVGKTHNRHRRHVDGDHDLEKDKSYEISEYRKRDNIWEYNVANCKDKTAHEHPAIFPERLALDHIQTWTKTGDLVFDPMCGSGTVGKMALSHGRYFIGVDISPEYIAIAEQRLGMLKYL